MIGRPMIAVQCDGVVRGVRCQSGEAVAMPGHGLSTVATYRFLGDQLFNWALFLDGRAYCPDCVRAGRHVGERPASNADAGGAASLPRAAAAARTAESEVGGA